MQVNVKKYLFIGSHKDKESFFEKSQKYGIIEFIDKNERWNNEPPVEIKNIQDALKILSNYPPIIADEIDDNVKIKDIVDEILSLNHKKESLLEQRRFLRHEIERVEVFGDFSRADIAYLEKEGGLVVQFFFAKKDVEIDFNGYKNMINVGSNHSLDYFVSFNKERVQYDGVVEMTIDKSVVELEEELSNVTMAINDLESQLRQLCFYHNNLYEYRVEMLNYFSLNSAQDVVDYQFDNQIFAVEGWVAESNLLKIEEIVAQHNIYVEEISIEEGDIVPVYLDNKKLDKIGEDLVNIYDAPSVSDKDPSKWVLWSFALFFAIIIGDGGYGFIFMIVGLFLMWKFPDIKGVGKRMIKLTLILSSFCIIWGGMTASFFGIELSPDNKLRELSFTNALVEKKAHYHLKQRDDVYQKYLKAYPDIAQSQCGAEVIKAGVDYKDGNKIYHIMNKFNDNINMELALLIGIIHIISSFLRYIKRNWAGFGWVLFMIGGYLYFPEMLQATSMLHFVAGIDKSIAATAGQYLIYGGIGSAVVLSLIQKRITGILEISNVIQVFSDVLSYLRLYALGLAGSMMSQTFNEIGASVSVIPGILIILIGHAVNIVLSVMSGVIHGLRLNFLEWYHYSFEGGGKLLQPLRLLKRR